MVQQLTIDIVRAISGPKNNAPGREKVRKTRILGLLGAASVVAVIPSVAQAQASPSSATQAPEASGSPSDQGGGEIVVTANKREENLSRVGLSVTAIGGEALAERRITSVQDIAAVIPGLKFSESGTATPIYTLRGVGFNEESLGVYPSVSVYVDEVPLPFPVLTLHTAYDLQRVEALKGPQGTLFGENATGGAINYIAAKPTKDTRYGADLSYGRFNQVDGNAFISGTLAPDLTGRVAVTAMHRDGWQQSYTRPGDHNGKISYFAGRGSLAWNAGPGVRFLATINGWKDKTEPQAAQLIAIRPQQPTNVHAATLAYPFSPETPRAADWSTGYYRPSSDRSLVQGALRADVDLGTVATLTSLTSYLDFKQNLFSDKDGTSQLIANIGPSLATIRSFNQELRLANQGQGAIKWVLGANYENSKTREDQSLRFLDGSSSNPYTLGINSTGSLVAQNIRNIAAFGNVQYDVTSKLTLKLGGRYTDSRNSADLCGYANGDGLVAPLFNILGGLLGTVPFTPIGTGGCYLLNAHNVPGDHFRDTLHEHNFSWLAGVNYKLDDNSLLYANASRGYKAGSFPTLAGSTFQEYIPVRQESVTSYEAGIKTSFADRRIRLTAAGFYYDYKNKQVRGKIVDPVFDVLDTLLNVPKSRIYGAEGELTIRATSDFTLGATATYLKSEVLANGGNHFSGPTAYGRSCGTSAPANCDFTGDELPFTPKYSYSLSIDYKHVASDRSAILAGIDMRGQSSAVSTLHGRDIAFRELPGSDRHITTTNRPFAIPGYSVIDARVGYQLPGGNVKMMLWGKNVFNKYYLTNVNHYLDTTVRFTGQPASYGVTLSIKN